MMELSVVVDTLMKALTAGGASAATDLFKGAVLGGTKALSNLWRSIFAEQPEAYPLADKVVKDTQNAEAHQALRSLLEDFFKQNPERLQQVQQLNIQTGDIKAEPGGVAVGVSQNSHIQIINKK